MSKRRPSASDRFEQCLAETLRWEGGYSNDPIDPGGATMKGIIQTEYDAWRSRRRLKPQDVRKIETAELTAIYLENYWQPLRCGELPAGLDLLVFDFGVNSGVGTAIRKLQKCLCVDVDGHIGSITLDTAAKADFSSLGPTYMDSRRAYLKSLKTFWRFGKGWLRRCDGVEKAAELMSMSMATPVVPSADIDVAPLPDPDEQSQTQGRAVAAEKTSMAQSKTGWAAVFGTGGVLYSLWDKAWDAITQHPERLANGITALASDIAARPGFWITAGTGAALVFVWLDRRSRMREGM